MKSRAEVRGKRIHPDCNKATRTTHEYPDDDRVFCYGLYDPRMDWQALPMCLECKAYVKNATPPEEQLK